MGYKVIVHHHARNHSKRQFAMSLGREFPSTDDLMLLRNEGIWKPNEEVKASWHIRWLRESRLRYTGEGVRWWWHIWKPVWHSGRGRYVSIGLGWVAIYRGY